MPMGIEFKEVTHSYKGYKKKDVITAIKDINLNIEECDEFVSIVGRTGSGKSTLISHMNGILLPSSGTVSIFNEILTPKKNKNPKLKPIRKRVGFVFQFPEYQLFEETVYKDICFAPKNFGFKEEEIKKNVSEVCNILGINEDILQKSPFNLSGGQMRKVAVAGILAYNPDILVLDEPTRGLDPIGAEELMEIFLRIHKELHKTIILISHDMNLVYRYSTRVVVMKDARIVYDGDKVNLFSNDKYKDYFLDKPEILHTIDEINKKLGYNLDYNYFNQTELLDALRELTLGGNL
ncbi:MAG: energy-coupling factor transporter ATPase [Anaeroplasmataceae bacterium]